MPSPEQVARVASEWVEKAEHDFQAAVWLLELGQAAPTDVVCFHAQQCVERYSKSLMVLAQLPVPKTHDIEKVLALMPEGGQLSLTPAEMRALTGYAAEMRYPGHAPVSLEEAQRAVELARRVRAQARDILPEKALEPERD